MTRRSEIGSTITRRLGRGSSEGFTLIEMMVALGITGIAMSSLYYVGAGSSRGMLEQSRVAQLQTAVQTAMDRLRTDLERAGFGGTPNSTVEGKCVGPDLAVRAIEYDADPGAGGADGPSWAGPAPAQLAAINRAKYDRVRLVGNYSTSDVYLVTGISSDGATVYLNKDYSQAWARSFPTEADFTDVFQTHRIVHIQLANGKHFFKKIASSSFAAASITFVSAIATLGSTETMRCMGGWGEGATVAPISRVQYEVRLPASTEGEVSVVGQSRGAMPASDALDYNGARGRKLIRTELLYTADTGVAATTEVVLDFVADFRLNWRVDTAASGTPTFDMLVGTAAETYLDANPQDARSVHVWLAARTPARNGRVPWPWGTPTSPTARPAGSPFTLYRIHATKDGTARVRQVNQEVYLPNLTTRGMR